MLRQALIVVAKEPRAGETKTRLTPPLDGERAAELYRCLMLDTFELMAAVPGVDRVIAYTPDESLDAFRAMAPAGFALVPQGRGDLGARLDQVLRKHLLDGYDRAVVMNSDGPTLPAGYLVQAFARLDDPAVDLVLGPSDDGGYYLIGIKSPCAALFDVVMSTPTVLRDTLRQARRAGLRVSLLDPWYDIDTWDDVERLDAELSALPMERAKQTRAFLRERLDGRLASAASPGSE